MNNELRNIFKSREIIVPEEDFPILEKQWEWISRLKDQTKEIVAGSHDIAIIHFVRGQKTGDKRTDNKTN